MNGLETKFSLYLEDLKSKGEILRWRFEPVRFKLVDFGNTTHYTPDFEVLYPNYEKTYFETKGGPWTSSARVKIKVCADRNWEYKFVGVRAIPKKRGGGWEFEEFEPKGEK